MARTPTHINAKETTSARAPDETRVPIVPKTPTEFMQELLARADIRELFTRLAEKNHPRIPAADDRE